MTSFLNTAVFSPARLFLCHVENYFINFFNPLLSIRRSDTRKVLLEFKQTAPGTSPAVLFCLLFIFVPLFGVAQTNAELESIVPPPPNAAELGKYGSYPVGTMTGIPEISISLYEVQSGTLKLPIILSYHASGIQVGQKATDAGLGWSIMAGGTISRTIYGSPDDATNGFFNYVPPTYETLFDIKNYFTLQQYATGSGYDLEPDLFVYNVGGKSGKFIYRRDRNFLTIPFAPIVIEKISENPIKFKIIDDNGDSYYFLDYSSSSTQSQVITDQRNRVNSWHLSYVISADLADTISFTYEPLITRDEVVQHSYPLGKKMVAGSGASATDVLVNGPGSGSVEITTTVTDYDEQLVKRIKFKNGYIDFNRNTVRKDVEFSAGRALDEMVVYNSRGELVKKVTFHHDYFLAQPFVDNFAHYRLKLTGITESGFATGEQRKHTFEYNSTPLPRYGSSRIDYWGYFNGSSNTILIPSTKVYYSEINGVSFANGESYSNEFSDSGEFETIGSGTREPSENHMKASVLEKIVYPTGGYTVFEFEPHEYMSDEYLKMSVAKPGSGGLTTSGINKLTKAEQFYDVKYPTQPEYTAVNSLTIWAQLAIYFSASHMGNTEMGETQLVRLINTDTDVQLKQWRHEGDLTVPLTINEPVKLVRGTNYKIIHEVYGNNDVYINSKVSWEENTNAHPTKIGGGLRIKSTKSFVDPNSDPVVETYVYGVQEDGVGTKVFEETKFYRNYEDVVSAYYTAGGQSCWLYGTRWIRNFLGISKYNPINYSGSPVLYEKVTKYLGTEADNVGKTVYHYSIPNEPPNVPDEFINSGNYGSINKGWFQGELGFDASYKRYQNSYLPVQENTYGNSTFNKVTEYAILLKQHKRFIQLAPGCTFDPSGPNPSSNRYGQGFFTMYKYPIESGARRLTDQYTSLYDQAPTGDAITTETKLKYDNPSHLYVTEKSVSTSVSDAKEVTRMKYPQDMSDPVSQSMVSKNMVNPVLETTVSKRVGTSEILLSTLKTEYQSMSGMIKPSCVKMSLGSDPLQPRILYNSYNSLGRVTERQRVSDTKEAYIWGYQGEYIVARIVGKSYDAVIQESGINLSLLNDPTRPDGDMRQELSKLLHLEGCMVTTYTYKPTVGVTSMTDPNGQTTYYIYDSMGRLSMVKDNEGNVIKTFAYNYVND